MHTVAISSTVVLLFLLLAGRSDSVTASQPAAAARCVGGWLCARAGDGWLVLNKEVLSKNTTNNK